MQHDDGQDACSPNDEGFRTDLRMEDEGEANETDQEEEYASCHPLVVDLLLLVP